MEDCRANAVPDPISRLHIVDHARDRKSIQTVHVDTRCIGTLQIFCKLVGFDFSLFYLQKKLVKTV